MADEEPRASSNAAAGSAANEAAQEFVTLRCNFIVKDGNICGRSLADGWVTSCSHIFCQEHAQEWFEKDNRCPICLDKQGKVRMIKVATSSNQPQSRVQKLLIGRSPADIMLATSTAMKFWIEQKLMEGDLERRNESLLQDQVKRLVGNGRKRLTEAETLTKSLQAGTDELRRQLRESEGQVARNREELARLQARCDEVRQVYKQTLQRAAGFDIRSTPRLPRIQTLQGMQSVKDDLDFCLQRSVLQRGRTAVRSRSPQQEEPKRGGLKGGDASASQCWPR